MTDEQKKSRVSRAAAILGRLGGLTKTDKPRGFAAMPKEKRVAAGHKGGTNKAINRRTAE